LPFLLLFFDSLEYLQTPSLFLLFKGSLGLNQSSFSSIGSLLQGIKP
jgi:hypothetical protein